MATSDPQCAEVLRRVAAWGAPAVPSAEQFIGSQGRGKFVRPLITALAEDKQWGRPIAVRVYAKSRPLYHPSVTKTLDKLGLSAS